MLITGNDEQEELIDIENCQEVNGPVEIFSDQEQCKTLLHLHNLRS